MSLYGFDNKEDYIKDRLLREKIGKIKSRWYFWTEIIRTSKKSKALIFYNPLRLSEGYFFFIFFIFYGIIYI